MARAVTGDAASIAAATAMATQTASGSFADMSTERMRSELSSRGLVSGGSRAELLERLSHAISRESERPLQRLASSRTKAQSLELACGKRIKAARQMFLGTNYSTTYSEPLHIARASGQYMYDGDGRQYLDGYNNVPHVGHCHPRVAEAVGQQMMTLQTNTRYLYRHLPEYAARLASLFPKPLSHVFFVNSGSEANDMALRIALAYTGGDAIISLQEAYHGNTIACQGVSPTAHYNPQAGASEGKRRSPATQAERLLALRTIAVPVPDPFRPFTTEPLTGSSAAKAVDDVMQTVEDEGNGVAAMIAESIMGVGGQIVYPEGYLAEVARRVRQRKGLFILDEVQTGFGRIGTHLWAFEDPHHGGVVPDIVTLGKPMGNGFPLAAVVTTPELAKVLKGEYFNTFGGAPVACAAGMAVLDVLEEEHLCSNAEWVGRFLKNELQLLSKSRHTCMGDVRGSGLFLGIELVKDTVTKEPDSELCKAVVNRMKDQGILVSYDGPYQNVIRIKPPMCFSKKNAEMLVDRLDDSLTRLQR